MSIVLDGTNGITTPAVSGDALASQAEAQVGTDNTRLMTPLRVSDARQQIMIVTDEKGASDSGGTFTSGAYRTRDLNTIRINNIMGASLASNQITLPAGTYKCWAQAPAYRVEGHVAILQQVSGTPTTLILGTNAYSGDSSFNNHTSSYVEGVFTLTAPQVLELQHRANTSTSTNGLGVNGGTTWAPSIFSTVFLEKVG